MGASEPSVVLTAVARLVAEARSLHDVVARIVTILRDSVPFEELHVLRLARAESFVLYSARASGEVEVTSRRISGPAGLPEPGESNARSRLVCTVRQGVVVHGALWLTSSVPDAFTPEHQDLLDGVSDLLELAFQSATVAERDTLRRERIDSLRGLLHTMAGSLDLRQVFNEISDVVRGGLPHDILMITSWGANGTSFRLYALAGAQVDDPAYWTPNTPSEAERAQLGRDAYIIRDANAEISADTLRGKLFRELGVGSALRVPMPLGSDVFGSIFFLSRDTEHFVDEDIDFARRVADHLALAISHQRLSDAARRDAESRETAARLEAQVATLTRELETRTGQRRVVGQSREWRDVLAQAARVARTETTVLLTGESGTGKEVVARFVHHASRRSQGPFVAINCAALPDQLLESELFGYERGAFTGAVSAKSGRIEHASGGVLFLDEVGEMAPQVQAKLLRVLE
jgi:transcriptional regulator with GAF, ATPase, and Fis domain